MAMPSMRNCVDLLGIQDYFSCRLGIGDYCRTKYLQTGNWNEALQYMRRTCIAIQENDSSLAHPLKYTVAPPNSSNAAAGASKQGTDYCIPSDVSRLLLSPHRQLPYPHCSISSRLIQHKREPRGEPINLKFSETELSVANRQQPPIDPASWMLMRERSASSFHPESSYSVTSRSASSSLVRRCGTRACAPFPYSDPPQAYA